jgi:ATP-dependent DNA ligase
MRPHEVCAHDRGQAEVILVGYDVMELDGQDVRPEPLEERRKRSQAALAQ